MSELFSKEFKEWFERKYGCTVEKCQQTLVPVEADLEDLAEAFIAGTKVEETET